MPAADVQRIHAAVVAAFADPAVKEAMAKQGNVINVAPADKAHALLPQRDGQVRATGEEGGRRGAVIWPDEFGRLLFLCRHDPAQVREQLAGRVLTRAQAGALRDEISTDEITPLPAWCTSTPR